MAPPLNYSKEEFANLGDEIYESQVRSASATKVVRRLKQGIMAKSWRFALGQHFAIEIEAGAIEVAENV